MFAGAVTGTDWLAADDFRRRTLPRLRASDLDGDLTP